MGEWVALDAVTHPSDGGVGFAEAALYDEDGRIGRSVQSLLFDRLERRARRRPAGLTRANLGYLLSG